MIIRRHRTPVAISCIFAILGSIILTSCYRAGVIEGAVVDEQTGKPLAGIAVVAHWQARGPELDFNTDGQLGAAETTTDEQGHYSLPGWGPHIKWFGKVTKVSIQLLYFKSGYQGLVVQSGAENGKGPAPMMNLVSETSLIKLRAAEATPRPRIEAFDLFNVAVQSVVGNTAACPWKQIPAMLREIHKETLVLQEHALDSDAWPLMTVDENLIRNADKLAKQAGSGCGSPKEVFQLQSPSR